MAVIAYLYLPAGDAEIVRAILRLVTAPALVITGLLLWRPAAIHRLVHRS